MRPAVRTLMLTSLLALASAATACNPNTLNGSENVEFSLAFTSFIAIQQQDYLLLQYNDGDTITCKISLNTAGKDAAGQPLNLTSGTKLASPDFLPNVTFTRVSTDGNTYPALTNGNMTLSEYNFTVGGEVSGNFYALFTDQHDLYGDFQAKVQAGSN